MINISNIVDALRSSDEALAFYYDRIDDRIISVDAFFSTDAYEQNPELYIPLPVLYEDDVDEIIDRFIQTVDLEPSVLIELSEAKDRNELLQKQIRIDPALERQWLRFYTEALSSIARHWCGENEIDYEQPAAEDVETENTSDMPSDPSEDMPGISVAEMPASNVDDAVVNTPDLRKESDATTTIQDLKAAVADMCQYRGWGGEKAIQNPQKMVMAMTIELGELMEHFTWLDDAQIQELVNGSLPIRRDHIAEELADILIYAIQLARGLDIDIASTMIHKMDIVKRRREDPDYGRSHPHVGLDEQSLFGCNDGSYENISSLVYNVD